MNRTIQNDHVQAASFLSVFNSRRLSLLSFRLSLTRRQRQLCLLMPMFTVCHTSFRPADLVHGLSPFLPQTTLSKLFIYSAVSTCALRFLMHSVFLVMLMAACHRWEFFTTLGFEWEVFTGRRPWKWSFTVYLTSRLLALMAVICNFIGFNLTIKFDCNVSGRSRVLSFGADKRNLMQVWFRCNLAASWFSVAIASFLLALRGQVIHGPAFPAEVVD